MSTPDALRLYRNEMEKYSRRMAQAAKEENWKAFDAAESNFYAASSEFDLAMNEWERAALADAGQAPQGWVLVPLEPTPAMISEGMSWRGHSPRTIYAAMLAARPQAEQPTTPPTAG